MADTHVKKIVSAIAALLNGAGKPTGLEVTASRIKASQGGKDYKRMAVFPIADNPKPENVERNRKFSAVHRILTVVVECRCAGSELDNEALREWAIAEIMKDCSLGGLVLDINEGTTAWDESQDAQAGYNQALMEILVEYTRAKSSLHSL